MKRKSSAGKACRAGTRLPGKAFVLAVGLIVQGCAEPDATTVLRGATMGTTYTIKIAEPVTAGAADVLHADIDGTLERINRSMSTWDPESELSRINRGAAGQWFDLSDDLHAVLSIAASVYRDSGGAFDVTIGPLVNLWGFGPPEAAPVLPSPEQRVAARELVGFDRLRLRSEPPALMKDDDAQYIDLSAIAKGYAVDRIAALLQRAGYRNFMVEIGGELRLAGSNPDGGAWRIAVERPSADGVSREDVLNLSDTALATSGDYRNFREIDGRRYGHTLDPRTGAPVTHTLAAVTVLHEEAVRADAYATACLVLGPDSGPALAVNLGLAARFVAWTATGTAIRETPAYARIAGRSAHDP